MNHELDNLETFSRFLLGELPPEEEERMEIRLLDDAGLQDLVEAAEFELIDDYLHGALSVDDAACFETHFLNSPARRRKLQLARIFPGPGDRHENQTADRKIPDNVVPFDSRRKPVPSFIQHAARRQAFRIAAGLLCTLGLATVLWLVVWPAWQLRQGMASLNDAYQKGRPIEARLSGFAYAPWEKDRGPGDERTDPLLRDRGTLTLLEVARAHPNANTYRALGSSYLLKREIKLAIEQFEKSLQYDPNNALTHNDLGAALMESAQSKQQQLDREKDKTTPVAEQLSAEIFSDLSLANEHFSQALQVDATVKDTVFNQAICLERLGLLGPALRGWEQYLNLDPDGGWRDEAKERIEALKKQKQKVTFDKERIFREFLAACESGVEDDIWQAFLMGSQMRGNLIIDRLLDEYLALLSQGDRVEARKKLDLLITAGRIEAQKSGDLYTRDLAEFYRLISPQQVALLSSARRTYKNAIEMSRTSRQEGLALCQQAREEFARIGSRVEAALADTTIGAIYALTSERDPAKQILEGIEKYSDRKGYLWLRARAFYLMGGLETDRNSSTRAINHCNEAIALVERRQDQRLQAGILVQLTDSYLALGHFDRATDYARQILEICRVYPIEPETLWSAYGSSADSLNGIARLFTSLFFEAEALQLAIVLDRPLQVSRSHGYLSDIYAKLNRYTEAIREAREDLEIGNRQGDNQIGRDIKSHALLRLGHLFRKNGQLNESLEAYNECIKISEEMKMYYERLDAYRGRLRLYLQTGDHFSAQKELENAVEFFERNRNQIDSDDLKTNFFETGRDIYDSGVELAVENAKDYRQAFHYSEQGRARSLRDLLQADNKQPPNNSNRFPPDKRSDSSPRLDQIPAFTQVIQYTSVYDSLYVWVITNSDFTGVHWKVHSEELRAKVDEYMECIKDPQLDGRATLLSKELYSILISRLEPLLDPKKELVVVTDKPFHHLPFAALINPTTSKFLLEKYIISYSPSTSVFLQCADAARSRTGFSTERCLSVGISVFRQSGLLNSALPSTRQEAEQVATRYGANAKLLLDNTANEPTVREKMKDAEVIHIASHALVNERRPEYSGLALWEETADRDDGMLNAWEISRLRLPNARLVVLSACQTMVGRTYQGEGVVGLARAFLVAGAPLVIATLWKVDSQITAKFMDGFHRRRIEAKMSTALALCETQREMLKMESAIHRRPSAWAGFILIGGYATY